MKTKKSKRPRRDKSRFTMKAGTPEDYACGECPEVTTIFRNPPHIPVRKVGHKKHIWCLPCERITLHTQVSRA